MTLAYAHEKFSQAIYTLAISSGEIKPRLIEAFTYHLANTQPDRDLPEELRDEFRQLVERVTKKEPGYRSETRMQATLHRMRNTTAVEIAKEIMSLAYRIQCCLEEERKHS